MRTKIFVNRNTLRRNVNAGKNDPPIEIRDRNIRQAHRVDILHEGEVVASVVYDRDSPRVKCWVETELEVRLETDARP